jgi:hypothetical protein
MEWLTDVLVVLGILFLRIGVPLLLVVGLGSLLDPTRRKGRSEPTSETPESSNSHEAPAAPLSPHPSHPNA